ncbi:rhodanese-related sulfurtransferase [Kitasatospora atroaurantiaca]|uniref:Rhodanese-related sulfurtransferase n=1 Tax=Kitasatospora atroaurantiaca TaxID=285545 RepID=A0A561EJ05_9ACTN|nr:rhodanese-like domain-containing protein [Kitasatospora atroaurantiaca]TWE15588.1 rhodanese-related sulfurtransferase [Kitasatospora atroaurantiaca]
MSTVRRTAQRHQRRVSPTDARSAQAAGAVLLDVREHAEWKAGRAPGTLHWPLSRLARGRAPLGELSGRQVITVCCAGKRSQHAVALLAARGIAAQDLDGGLRAWARAGHPVVDGSDRPGTIL